MMNPTLQSVLNTADHWIANNLGLLTTGLVATLLTIYGNRINGTFRKWTKSMNFLLRYLCFVLLCTFGYTFLTDFLLSKVRWGLGLVDPEWRVGTIIASFLLVAWLARREREL